MSKGIEYLSDAVLKTLKAYFPDLLLVVSNQDFLSKLQQFPSFHMRDICGFFCLFFLWSFSAPVTGLKWAKQNDYDRWVVWLCCIVIKPHLHSPDDGDLMSL